MRYTFINIILFFLWSIFFVGCSQPVKFFGLPQKENDSENLVLGPIQPVKNLVFKESFECRDQPNRCRISENYGNWFIIDSLKDWNIRRVLDGKQHPIDGSLEIQVGKAIVEEAPPDGNQYAELDGHFNVTISRNLNTLSNRSYTVRFFARARDSKSQLSSILRVSAAGKDILVLEETKLPLKWSLFQASFVASSEITVIVFGDYGVSDGLGALIDDIEVSEP